MSTISEILNEQDMIDFIEALSITFKDISSEKIVEILPKLIAYVQKYKKTINEKTNINLEGNSQNLRTIVIPDSITTIRKNT